MDKTMADAHPEPPVLVGVSPSCPYGIGACWGGALDALKQLNGVAEVRPLHDTADSTAFVYLKGDALPDIDVWRAQFADVANGSYIMRGIEMTLEGKVTDHFGLLTLGGDQSRPDLVLAPLQGTDKVQWDLTTRSNQPMTAEEASAYTRLSAKLATQSNGTQVQVTGPLRKNGSEFFLEVREFKV
jgi:galactose oxidase